jgi:hypothetical protein
MSKRGDKWRERVDYRVGNTINEAFLKIPASEAREMFAAVEKLALERGLVYQEDDGTPRAIPIAIRPRVFTQEQRRYTHKACLELMRAYERLAAVYQSHESVREVLPFTDEENRWLADIRRATAKKPQCVFGRLDANVDFADLDWEERFAIFEVNSVGVGGIYYTPTCEAIIHEVVGPAMREHAPGLLLKPNDDYRDLLLQQLTSHARVIGRRRLNIAMVQESDPGGAQEYERIAEHFAERGVEAIVCDPRELELHGDEILAKGTPVDIVYRDVELEALRRYEREGADMSAMKDAFKKNMVVSTIVGEFDHKSTAEVFSDERFHPLFTRRQVSMFRKHVPWTRLVSERKTSGPDGGEIDLVPWLRHHKDWAVLKPNRGFGGQGLVIGPHADFAEWEEALDKAVREPSTVVAQRYVEPVTKDFPVLAADGSITLEEYYAVLGFTATMEGLAILGRASKRRVVNVAQRGCVTAMLVLI